MSELPAPVAIPERQDARRHGKPSGRGERRSTSVRAGHLFIAVLPALVMAILGLLAVIDVHTVGFSSPRGRLSLIVLAVGAVVVLGAAVLGAGAATRREPRVSVRPAGGAEDLLRRLGGLGFLISRGRQDLRVLAERVAAGETPPPDCADPPPALTGDPVGRLAYELQVAQNEARSAVVNAANLSTDGGPTQRVEIFVNLARRMQSLSHRAIKGLDELENQVEDPDLLKGLFRVDHLSTRMRRQAESLAVIGGAASRRQWSRPVTLYEVLRSAIAEVEHYNRVKVVPPVEGTLDGAAVADVIHLLAELIENATKFAAPHTQVLLRVEAVTAGLAVEIEDRGLGIPRESQHQLNDLLADLERVDTDELLKDGRIGLLVVSALSRRHSIAVRLQTNLYGGTQAVVVIPNELIGAEQEIQARPEYTDPVPVPAAPATVTASAPAAPAPAPAAPAPLPAPPPVSASGPEDAGLRPELPRRRAQTHLVPELLTTPALPDDGSDADHNPGLMAAFLKGMRSGEDEGPADGTGSTA